MLGLIILQVVLIALNAVFSCAELAVLSINETKLERMADQGDKRAKRLFKLTREPAKFLAQFRLPSPCPASWVLHLRLTDFLSRWWIG